MDRNISTADFIKEISEFQNNHGYRVGKICCKIWDIIKPSGISKEHLKLAGQLHDAGKLLIPPNILNAARKLTPEETAIIHQHPAGGVAFCIYRPSDTFSYAPSFLFMGFGEYKQKLFSTISE